MLDTEVCAWWNTHHSPNDGSDILRDYDQPYSECSLSQAHKLHHAMILASTCTHPSSSTDIELTTERRENTATNHAWNEYSPEPLQLILDPT